jgi:hypothetical protein
VLLRAPVNVTALYLLLKSLLKHLSMPICRFRYLKFLQLMAFAVLTTHRITRLFRHFGRKCYLCLWRDWISSYRCWSDVEEQGCRLYGRMQGFRTKAEEAGRRVLYTLLSHSFQLPSAPTSVSPNKEAAHSLETCQRAYLPIQCRKPNC